MYLTARTYTSFRYGIDEAYEGDLAQQDHMIAHHLTPSAVTSESWPVLFTHRIDARTLFLSMCLCLFPRNEMHIFSEDVHHCVSCHAGFVTHTTKINPRHKRHVGPFLGPCWHLFRVADPPPKHMRHRHVECIRRVAWGERRSGGVPNVAWE